MEETLKEDVELELDIGREKFDSAMANLDSGRFRSATSDLYFSLEHFAKALLLTIGVEAQSHQGILTLLGKHFVKPGSLPVHVGRQMGNLHERRITAEYSRRAGWEFTAEELATFTDWYAASAAVILEETARMAPDLKVKIESLSHKLRGVLVMHGRRGGSSGPEGE
jgi:uncharacterized protein (UPF0332 family)